MQGTDALGTDIKQQRFNGPGKGCHRRDFRLGSIGKIQRVINFRQNSLHRAVFRIGR